MGKSHSKPKPPPPAVIEPPPAPEEPSPVAPPSPPPVSEEAAPPPASPVSEEAAPPPASPVSEEAAPPPASPASEEAAPPPASPASEEAAPPPAPPVSEEAAPPPASPVSEEAAPPPASPVSEEAAPLPASPAKKPRFPYLFAAAESNTLPDPSLFFSHQLLSSPLPTNSFFQNFVLNYGDQPEYIHPYLVKLSDSSLSLSFPSRSVSSSHIRQVFSPDLTISGSDTSKPNPQIRHIRHIISAFSDLSVTVDLPSSNLRFFLVRGSPFITCSVITASNISISTIHAIISFCSNSTQTRYSIKLSNNQTWIIYTSSPINLVHDISRISSDSFSGVIRIAILPDSDLRHETVLDRFSSCYPVSGEASFPNPFCVEYRWEKKGWGDLLLLAHPLHLKLLSRESGCGFTILDDFRYKSIDGELVGVVGDSWRMKTDPVSITWHSIRGIHEESHPEIISALSKDVEALDSTPISTSSSYFYGKSIARAARLALIAEEVCYPDAIPPVIKFLKDTIDLSGFLYDPKWGGLVTKQGAMDSEADFGFGVYNSHHHHLGYFLYAIAVLSKIDPAWGRKHKPQAYALMADFMNMGKRAESTYTRLRCFDLYKLHSWAGGLTEFADGRNQESSSQAVNAYYSAALMGLAYGDSHLIAMGSTLAALEIEAAKTWWHVKTGKKMYEEEFSSVNKLVGVVWANKRDSGLWFAPADWRECRVGIQVLPVAPISEVLFSDGGFVKEVVEWTTAALEREGVGEGWKGFVYALEGMYDKDGAAKKIRNLTDVDDGESISNLLWWVHSRGSEDDEFGGRVEHCWYGHYCH